jgi:hypothetical protein
MKDRRYNKCLYVTCHLKKYAFYKFRAWVVDGLRELGRTSAKGKRAPSLERGTNQRELSTQGVFGVGKRRDDNWLGFQEDDDISRFLFFFISTRTREPLLCVGFPMVLGWVFLLFFLLTFILPHYPSSFSSVDLFYFITRGWERRDGCGTDRCRECAEPPCTFIYTRHSGRRGD